jgi:ATP adenylyltransferase
MSVPALSAPWRMNYIKSLGKTEKQGTCFLCDAAAAGNDLQRRERLVLWQTDLSVVLINRYPYANGHLLVAPLAHLADLEALSLPQMHDLMLQTTRAVQLLKIAVSAQGFNIGLNIGRVAGAGVPGHLHQHIVPRWGGDINFMHVIGEVGVIPEANSLLYEELLRVMASL